MKFKACAYNHCNVMENTLPTVTTKEAERYLIVFSLIYYFQNSNLSYLVAFKQNIRCLSIKDPGLISNNITKHLQRVQEGKYAFIASMVMLPLAYAKCQLEMIDARLSSSYTAFHLPKSSPFKHDLQE